ETDPQVPPTVQVLRPTITEAAPNTPDAVIRPISGFFSSGAIIRTLDGRLMAAFIQPATDDEPEHVRTAFSDDGGRTWHSDRRVDHHPDVNRHTRPTLLQTRDGTVHVFYGGWIAFDRDRPEASRSDVWLTTS